MSQRIIVQLNQELTETQQQTLIVQAEFFLPSIAKSSNSANSTLKYRLEKVGSSNAKRLILKVNPSLSEQALNSFIKNIQALKFVKFVEKDQLLKPMTNPTSSSTPSVQ